MFRPTCTILIILFATLLPALAMPVDWSKDVVISDEIDELSYCDQLYDETVPDGWQHAQMAFDLPATAPVATDFVVLEPGWCLGEFDTAPVA